MKRPSPNCAPSATGMTLIELLVSLAVLSIIILAFATILTQTQKVVEKSNALMQANASASAIAQVLREDIASLYKDGFLDTHGGTLCMDFTAVGTYRSVFDPNVCSNSERIFYFLDPNAPNDPNKQTIFRCAFLLCFQDPPSGPDANGDDVLYNRYLTYYQSGGGTVDHNLDLRNLWGIGERPYPVTLPITEPNQVDKAWPVLATRCTRFAVSFLNPNTGNWDSNSSNGFAWGTSNPPPTWWPRAIRVEFRLKTGNKPQDYLDYEVICPVPQ